MQQEKLNAGESREMSTEGRRSGGIDRLVKVFVRLKHISLKARFVGLPARFQFSFSSGRPGVMKSNTEPRFNNKQNGRVIRFLKSEGKIPRRRHVEFAGGRASESNDGILIPLTSGTRQRVLPVPDKSAYWQLGSGQFTPVLQGRKPEKTNERFGGVRVAGGGTLMGQFSEGDKQSGDRSGLPSQAEYRTPYGLTDPLWSLVPSGVRNLLVSKQDRRLESYLHRRSRGVVNEVNIAGMRHLSSLGSRPVKGLLERGDTFSHDIKTILPGKVYPLKRSSRSSNAVINCAGISSFSIERVKMPEMDLRERNTFYGTTSPDTTDPRPANRTMHVAINQPLIGSLTINNNQADHGVCELRSKIEGVLIDILESVNVIV